MAFEADKQTLDDLNLLGKFKHQSIFSLLNQTRTRGGERLLESMFRKPLTTVEEINNRSAVIAFFSKEEVTLPISSEQHDQVTDYLHRATKHNLLTSFLYVAGKKIGQSLGTGLGYEALQADVEATLRYLHVLSSFISALLKRDVPQDFWQQLKEADTVLQSEALKIGYKKAHARRLGFAEIVRFDRLLQLIYGNQLAKLIDLVLQLDVYCAVGNIAAQRGFAFASASTDIANLDVDGFYHPWITDAIANAVSLDRESNVLFLTGANMAGKSTLMKAFGVVVYLAHMGFPVPAARMRFTPFDGMYTSINVSDNLNLGYSHFYAEVLRVKHVAQEVAAGKRLLVVFDELFKGTNVKDAYDATVAVTRAFSRYRRCCFIISTHITEAGQVLQQSEAGFRFAYMPTYMEDGKPKYTYLLQRGISDDRHGMIIINNEKIVEIIQGMLI
ncbi:MutS-related protein [Parapedobacter tibetensis]|uniref:MutS-related protein n=1 Tax=Parapedobacter tibetensis TaxID=2972951 RepID=UPI00214D64C1|nr:DNA mismatch repair protein [Parapedobacter tibetensis]